MYTPDVEYPSTNKSAINKTVNAINTIIAGLTPFKSYNLENTVYGRLVTNRTPLATIGLAMLGKQFALNSMSSIERENFPIFNTSNLFDKNSNLFTTRLKYRITSKSTNTSFQNFLDSSVYWYSNADNPFNNNQTNSDYIKNTGEGQLRQLYTNINRNLYYQSSTNIDKTFNNYATQVNVPLINRSSLLGNINKKYFDFNNNNFNPYNLISILPNTDVAIKDANLSMINSMNNEYKINSEYAPNIDFVKENFGSAVSNLVNRETLNDNIPNSWINDKTEFKNDIITNKLIWGRDGTNVQTDQYLSQLQGQSEEEVRINLGNTQDVQSKFNIKSGLLEYTRNLINSTQGRIGDITRKAFTNGGEIVGFNGSAMWKAPTTALSAFAGKTGIRQHTVLDQYDRFAKAIRFDGNKVYGGNENSVIYNSVLPKIHPSLDNEGKINNKNLMLSIENLAVRVISKEGVGIIDDEYGSQISASEVGPFNGRIMWFPPYGLELQEVANAKYEPTVMVGRNEPMYNYQNSERTAVLNFILLIDHPQQLRNYSTQKEIAEFFSFGGNDITIPDNVPNLELKEKQIQDQINLINKDPHISEPEVNVPKPFSIYFPNDIPKNDNDSTIIDKMYSGGYEILDNLI